MFGYRVNSFSPLELTVSLWDSEQIQQPEIVGYHGTSLEAVNILLSGKYLRGRPLRRHLGEFDFAKGAIHYFPNFSNLPENFDFLSKTELSGSKNQIYIATTESSIEQAIVYAHSNAELHHFASMLNLQLNNPVHYELLNEMYFKPDEVDRFFTLKLYEPCVEFLKERGYGRKELLACFKMMQGPQKRKGFLLAFSESIYSYLKPELGDEDWDLFINPSRGLHYSHIAAIIPLGKIEHEWIQNKMIQAPAV